MASWGTKMVAGVVIWSAVDALRGGPVALAASDQMVKLCSATLPTAVTLTVKGPLWLTAVGVPAMVPLDERERPGGRLP
jgi:hypothetical protein